MAPDAARWNRVQQLFHALADRPDEERSSELERVARTEPDLAREVRELLLADASDASLLDRGIEAASEELLRPPDED